MTARALYFEDPYEIEVRTIDVPDPTPEEVHVETTLSAISSGTELLLYRGEVPRNLSADLTIEALSGSFDYPLQYGYASVGRVVAAGAAVDDDLVGRRVFAFHPHASEFVVPVDDVVPIPDDCSDEAASLLANLEAATNFLLDGAPLVGENSLVLGQGVVGLLTTRLLAEFPLASLVTADLYGRRRDVSVAFGADEALNPDDIDVADHVRTGSSHESIDGVDLTYELSGAPAALSTAIESTGFGGRVVVGSWYGSKSVELDLGTHFHRDRIRILSSQVSTIDPNRRGRWSRERRLRVAANWLARVDVDTLVTHRLPIERAAEAYALLDDRPEDAIQVVLTY